MSSGASSPGSGSKAKTRCTRGCSGSAAEAVPVPAMVEVAMDTATSPGKLTFLVVWDPEMPLLTTGAFFASCALLSLVLVFSTLMLTTVGVEGISRVAGGALVRVRRRRVILVRTACRRRVAALSTDGASGVASCSQVVLLLHGA